jgi:beta-galactosidase GanA
MNSRITRRSFGQLVAGATISGRQLVHAALESPALSASDADGKMIFPFGTHVYREPHLPLEQFRRDFPILKKLGFNMIKIQEVWAYDERREGEIDLSNVVHVVADARQNGLRVYFGVTMENAPAWLWRKYPDATMVYETGQPHNDPSQYVLPDDGKPGPCWHHPEARAAGIKFVGAVGKEVGQYDNVEVWNVFQEIGLWQERPGHLGLCYCHNTLPAFRAWLQTRYSSLDTLNAVWRSGYGDWEEVEPPRFSPKVPPTIDFRYFMDDVYLSDSVKWKADAFRRSDPMRRPILAHVGWVTLGGTRDWRYAEELDVFGSSCYPGWSGPESWDADHPSAEKPLTDEVQSNQEMEAILLRFDYLRSAKQDRNIWTAELQGGPITEGLNRRRVPSPGDIRRWVLSCLAAGVRGICFWNHRPEIFWEEGYGFSLLDWNSDSSARAEEAGRLARAISDNAELFTKGSHPEPAVGVVVSEDLFHFAEGSLHDVLQHFQYAVTGVWKSLWQEGITAGFVESGAIPNDADRTKALLLPFPFALSQDVIRALTEYVKRGGTLISEACPGRFSNHGIAFEGAMAPGIADLFGAQHEGAFLIREPGKGAKWTNWQLSLRDTREYRDLRATGDFSDHSLFPAFYLQTLSPTTAQPLLRYGTEVAGTVNRLGKGQAYLVGTMLGYALPAYNDPRNARFLAAVLKISGVLPDSLGKLNRRRRIWGNREAWFLFNQHDRLIEEQVSMHGFKTAKDLLGGELTAAGGVLSIKVDPVDVRCILLESNSL